MKNNKRKDPKSSHPITLFLAVGTVNVLLVLGENLLPLELLSGGHIALNRAVSLVS